jgi:hypothetical protein
VEKTSAAIAELSELIKMKRPPGVSVSEFLSTLFETCADQIGTAKYGVLYTGRTFESALLEVFGDQWPASHTDALDFLKEFVDD